MRHLRVLIPLLLFLLSSAAAQAITINGSVLLSGSNGPAARAVVDFTGPERGRAVTIDDGTFYISSLATGTYTVTITYQGNVKTSFSTPVSPQASFTFYINP
jgi:hypothetical protein